MILPRGPTASDSLRSLAMPSLLKASAEGLRLAALVVDVTDVQLAYWGRGLATTTRGEVGMAGPVVEYPHGDPDTELLHLPSNR